MSSDLCGAVKDAHPPRHILYGLNTAIADRNHATAVALHHMHYNFARPHRSLANPYPRTPAMAAGIADQVWSCEEIADLLD